MIHRCLVPFASGETLDDSHRWPRKVSRFLCPSLPDKLSHRHHSLLLSLLYLGYFCDFVRLFLPFFFLFPFLIRFPAGRNLLSLFSPFSFRIILASRCSRSANLCPFSFPNFPLRPGWTPAHSTFTPLYSLPTPSLERERKEKRKRERENRENREIERRRG